MAQSRSPDEAMNTVLRAERDAREAIDACRAEAERTLAEAREQARRIARRTDARISALHTRCTIDLHRRVEAMLDGEREPNTPLPAASEDEVLQAAVDALAAELVGEDEA